MIKNEIKVLEYYFNLLNVTENNIKPVLFWRRYTELQSSIAHVCKLTKMLI